MSMSRAFWSLPDPWLMRARLAKGGGPSGPPRPGRRVAVLCPCLSGGMPPRPGRRVAVPCPCLSGGTPLRPGKRVAVLCPCLSGGTPPRPGRRVAVPCPCLSGGTPRAPLQKLRLGHWLCLELVPPTRVLCRDAHTAVNWPDHIGRIPAIRNSPTKTSPRGAWVWTLVQPTGKGNIVFSCVWHAARLFSWGCWWLTSLHGKVSVVGGEKVTKREGAGETKPPGHFNFYWSIIALQCCVSVCYTQQSESTLCVHVSPLCWASLPCTILPLSCRLHRAELPMLWSSFLLAACFTQGSV